MGMIADKLRARLDEMAARHAQTDREIAELKIQAQAAYDRWQAAAAALDAELADWVKTPNLNTPWATLRVFLCAALIENESQLQ